jgi:hypothetical protein
MTRKRMIKINILTAFVLLIAILTAVLAFAAPAKQASSSQPSSKSFVMHVLTLAPAPLINLPLVPDATTPAGAAFTLTVNGTGFVSGSVVNWNGGPRATTFVSSAQLTAQISAADIATAGTASVTVVNPAPGGGTSDVAFFTVANDTGTSVAFNVTSLLAAGTDPNSVAVGDFNGDGKLDLAVANVYSGTVSIFLGDGKGNFTLSSSPATGANPSSVAVGDFNGDGKLDLAVADLSSGTVTILLGDGKGSFTLGSSPAAGGRSISVVTGDFNGDGNLDLAVSNYYSIASILLGDGIGNFTLASSPAAGLNPSFVAIGDFNADGNPDLVFADSTGSTVSILLGDGAGNFSLAASPFVGSGFFAPVAVAIGDFNGDGKLDLAVADFNSSDVSILLNTSSGSATTTTLVSSLNPSVVGQAVTFTATVSSTAGTPPNGETITFKNGSAVLGTAPLNGGIR